MAKTGGEQPFADLPSPSAQDCDRLLSDRNEIGERDDVGGFLAIVVRKDSNRITYLRDKIYRYHRENDGHETGWNQEPIKGSPG